MTTCEGYLLDFGTELLDLARKASREANASKDAFESGKAMGLYTAVSLMKLQALAFQLDDSMIGMAGVEPDDILFEGLR